MLPIPREKCHPRVEQTGLLTLLVMQDNFFVELFKNSITSYNHPDPDIFAFDTVPTGGDRGNLVAPSRAARPAPGADSRTHAAHGHLRHGCSTVQIPPRILSKNIPTPELSCRFAITGTFVMRMISVRGIANRVLEFVMLQTG